MPTKRKAEKLSRGVKSSKLGRPTLLGFSAKPVVYNKIQTAYVYFMLDLGSELFTASQVSSSLGISVTLRYKEPLKLMKEAL